jgi:hypothetical protein
MLIAYPIRHIVAILMILSPMKKKAHIIVMSMMYLLGRVATIMLYFNQKYHDYLDSCSGFFINLVNTSMTIRGNNPA